jgi:myo-inositol 2-dehydrogenase / D-chiro-inositol 1-dehydrogenase
MSKSLNRRDFLKATATAAGVVSLPICLPHSVFGADAPSKRITIGCIGTGRMGQDDMRELLGHADAQIVAVCDVDSNRAADAKKLVETKYASRTAAGEFKGCDIFGDFRELIARKDIDAVMICTPDHWHVIPALAAARAGKDIFLQKPLSLTIEEGRVLSDTVRRYNRIFQVGSQQRSDPRFRRACEIVRNGRIGKLQRIEVGFGTDPGCKPQPDMPVPPNLNYDLWLGQTPEAPYTEFRVHPQKGYDRPGWLRMSAYGHGMITGWGSHHLDIVQWGMDTEKTGPVEIVGEAVYPKEGLWDVHGDFRIEYTYANGIKVICADEGKCKQGVHFFGDKGSVYVRRDFIDSDPKSILEEKFRPNEFTLYASNNHKRNWLDCIKSRAETIAPVEIAHRSCTVCLLGSIAMRLGRKLKWDPAAEKYIGDDEANAMRSRTIRAPWKL